MRLPITMKFWIGSFQLGRNDVRTRLYILFSVLQWWLHKTVLYSSKTCLQVFQLGIKKY